jgi:hypothetical protein
MRNIEDLTMRQLALPAFLLLLTAGSVQQAAAEKPREEYYLARKDIAPTVLRDTIGMVSVWRGQMESRRPEGPWMISTYERKGSFYKASRPVPMTEAQPISGWDFTDQALRQFPVVQRDGLFVLTVLDARSDRRAWLRVEKKPWNIDYLHYAGVAEPEAYSGLTIDLFHLAPESRRLYAEPRLDAPFRIASRESDSRGYLGNDLKVVKIQGNFAQVAKVLGPSRLSAPLGWVEIRDRDGRLTIWYVFAPGC